MKTIVLFKGTICTIISLKFPKNTRTVSYIFKNSAASSEQLEELEAVDCGIIKAPLFLCRARLSSAIALAVSFRFDSFQPYSIL